MIKIFLLFTFFSLFNCKNEQSNKEESSVVIEKKAEGNVSIPLKIELSEDEFVTEINFIADSINFKIYYLKNKETSYLQVKQFNDYRPVDFCINTSSMEDAKSQFRLFKKDTFYYLMIPTCTEELPIFHIVKFDDSNNFHDLGIYTFKYNEKIFNVGKFSNIKYTLVNQNNKVAILGSMAGESFYLSDITEFKDKKQVTSDDLNYINRLSNKNRNNELEATDFVDKTENSTLSKSFIFKFLTSRTEDEDGNEIQKIKINLKNKETNKIQEIDFVPESLVIQFNGSQQNSVSYFDTEKSIIKSSQEIEGGMMLITLDVNFDGLEDFAIINYQGSNGGPQYAYYIQKPNKQFVLDSYLTETVRFFPSEINKNKKTVTIVHPSGCCQIQTYKFQIQPNGEWKNIYSNLEDM